jgi:putative intracellular protease/amidase
MSEELQGKRIAFLVANEGVEQVELEKPWDAAKEAGGQPELIAPEPGEIQAFEHLDQADTFAARGNGGRVNRAVRADPHEGAGSFPAFVAGRRGGAAHEAAEFAPAQG